MNQCLHGGPGVNPWFDWRLKKKKSISLLLDYWRPLFRSFLALPFPNPYCSVMDGLMGEIWNYRLGCSVFKGRWVLDEQNSNFIFEMTLGPGDLPLDSQGLISCAALRHAADGQWGPEMSPVCSGTPTALLYKKILSVFLWANQFQGINIWISQSSCEIHTRFLL